MNGDGSYWTRRLRCSFSTGTTPPRSMTSPKRGRQQPCSLSISPASSSSTWPYSTRAWHAAGHRGRRVRSNAEPEQRIAATFGAYFEYVGDNGQAYRLVLSRT